MQETKETQVWFLDREEPLEEEKWQPTPAFLPEKPHGQWGRKELDMTE